MRVKRFSAACLCALLFAAPALAQEPAMTPQETLDDFFAAFTFVPENPLPGDLPWLLWQIAREAPQDEPEAELPPLKQAAARFDALVQGEGVHWEESASVMGMDIKSEYWMKGGSIRKTDDLTGETLLLHGGWLLKYSGKTGTRVAQDDPSAAYDVASLKNTMLSALASAPYERLEDEKVGKFDCEVYFLDVEIMGMKGNWLYVDKATGALVKNRFGEGKDAMVTELLRLEVGVEDGEFEAPQGVKWE